MRMNADAVTVSVQDKKHFAKKKKRALLLALSLLLIIGIVGIFAYMTSYIGAVNKGNKALERNDYTEAEDCFRNAMAKMTPDRKHTQAFQKFIRHRIIQKKQSVCSRMH